MKTDAKDYIGCIEVESFKNNFEYWDVMHDKRRNALVIGSSTNACFLESGFMEIEEDESLSSAIEELHAELEVSIMDGKAYCSRLEFSR